MIIPLLYQYHFSSLSRVKTQERDDGTKDQLQPLLAKKGPYIKIDIYVPKDKKMLIRPVRDDGIISWEIGWMS